MNVIDLAQKALTEIEAAGTMNRERSLHSPQSVSYTHLTLPTTRLV